MVEHFVLTWSYARFWLKVKFCTEKCNNTKMKKRHMKYAGNTLLKVRGLILRVYENRYFHTKVT